MTRHLATVKAHCIGRMCASVSLGCGVEWDEELIRTIEEASGTKPAISACMVKALQALGVRRVACAFRHEPPVDAQLKESLGEKSSQEVNVKRSISSPVCEIGCFGSK